jgi:nicotinamidase/pyrazinamidase
MRMVTRTWSAFNHANHGDTPHRKATGLGDWLREQSVNEVFVCGLATDCCVKFTALDAVRLGFKTRLIEDASRGVNLCSNDVANAIAEVKRAGVSIVHSAEILNRDRG